MRQLLIIYCFSIFFSLPQKAFAVQNIKHPKTKWKFKTQGLVRSTATIFNNNIYFGSSDGYIYGLDKNNGALIWKYKTNGAIVSKPLIHNNTLYVSSRDKNLYAININQGRLIWTFKMNENLIDNHGSWKYYMASPAVAGKNIVMGSGDGHLYSIDAITGKLDWKFETNGRIRATPLVHKNKIYQPSNNGYVYVLDINGKLDWKFETKGVSYNPENYPFDRSSIIAQPLIKDNILVIASRDGNTYGIDIKTHKELWNFAYGSTWAMSTNISGNSIYVGWSTNNKFCSLDLKTGKRNWDYKTGGHTYPKAIVSNTSVYTASSDGKLYSFNKFTGEKIWDYKVGNAEEEIYASLTHDSDTIFFGSDDGYFYAIDEGTKPYKIVYHPFSSKGKLQNPAASKKIAPYLVEKGFKHISAKDSLTSFIVNRLKDKAPSVIVFPYLVIPRNLIGINPEKGLIRQYLNAGGKIIWPGGVPNYFERDNSGKQIRTAEIASKLLNIEFENHGEFGNYFSTPTQEGQNWGLPLKLKTMRGVNVSQKDIIPFAYNEFNKVSIWMKTYNSRPGSGFISCRTWGGNSSIKEKDLALINQLAIYGLE